MCTLSLVTRENSYLLAMNRDERIARSGGELPAIHRLGGATAIYPSDGAGGTWIAANECGITLALLNWNDVVRRPQDSSKARSRGQIIPALGSSSRMAELQTVFGVLDLEGILPFRLVGVFPSEKTIGEWRWDALQLTFQTQGWHSRHWFSSSLSDKQAESLRGAACRNAQHESDAGTVPWLRRLHASHAGGPGPFSLCVHRVDVRTLSYSEVMVTPGGVQMGHFRGSPCTMGPVHPIEIARADCPDLHAWDVGSSVV
jgi:transport and Golgi organization protein 2